MADKLLVSAAFISLVEVGVAPAWMVVVIIGREFAVTGLRAVAAERGLTIAASTWGKIKMGFQVACIVFLLLSKPGTDHADLVPRLASPLGRWLLWVTLLVTVASGIEYFIAFRRVLEQPAAEPDETD
jgi:CDP-diacylglycerol--glycerol-3-phosphate 3-phosphatidyltransferase